MSPPLGKSPQFSCDNNIDVGALLSVAALSGQPGEESSDSLAIHMSQAAAVSPRLSSIKPGFASETGTVLVNVSGTKYNVVSQVAKELGMTVTEDSTECDLLWIDNSVATEKYLQLKNHQHVNHFPGMGEICRKDSLSRNMEKIRKLHKDEYNFVPRTWVLPSEYNSLSYHIREVKRKRKNKTFIIKPHNSAMGNGISLVRSLEDIQKQQNVVVQEYLDKPFLLDGFKIDLRVYVLVTSCNPLRIFVYKDGLVRLSTQLYVPPTDSNLDHHFMHLTNYSINKHNEKFDSSEEVDQGSKRTLQYFNEWLTNNGHSVGEMWAKIHDIIIKAIIVTSPHLVHSYQACRPGRTPNEGSQFFEILGFDIFLDDKLNPWLLEVNRAPSFATDSKLDLDIKSGLIRDTLRIINLRPSGRKREMVAHRIASRRRLIHTPPTKFSRYDFLAEQTSAAFQLEKKKNEVRDRLKQVRREKNQLEHEQMYIGDYVKIYPSTDWTRDKFYKTLITSVSSISLIGKKMTDIDRVASYLQKLKEHELLDLLSQYEDEEFSGAPGVTSLVQQQSSPLQRASANISYQPLSIMHRVPTDNVYKVMASRVAEEEQTQRMMISLNDMKPFYPGKQGDEIRNFLDQVDASLEHHIPNLANFWLVNLDLNHRKQLLYPLKHSIYSILHNYWRTDNIDSIRLYQIFKKLFSFFLSRGGRGLWSSFAPKEISWEDLFKEKSGVMSVTELVCCRRIMVLTQSIVKIAFYYHQLHHPSKQKSHKLSCSHVSHVTPPPSPPPPPSSPPPSPPSPPSPPPPPPSPPPTISKSSLRKLPIPLSSKFRSHSHTETSHSTTSPSSSCSVPIQFSKRGFVFRDFNAMKSGDV